MGTGGYNDGSLGIQFFGVTLTGFEVAWQGVDLFVNGKLSYTQYSDGTFEMWNPINNYYYNSLSYQQRERDAAPSKFRQFMDYTLMVPIDMLGGTLDFAKNYYDMRKLNLRNSDKYFHAKANFQATRRGPGGAFIAIRLSNLREIIDQRIKGDSWFDSMEDQRANIYGRSLGWEFRYYKGTIDYSEILKTYWYDYFPEEY